MKDFEDSTLWRVSGFERAMQSDGSSGFARLHGTTILPTTLLADLRRLDADPTSNDVVEVVAACLRHRESALLCLRHDDIVWPVTLFPAQGLYHSPRDLGIASPTSLASLGVLTTEAPGVRPPGHWMHERVARTELYRPLPPLLWSLALYGPRRTLLAEIAGPAAYRALKNPADDGLVAPGAMGSAVERLRRDSVAIRNMAMWPGMSVERCCRLLNALYLVSALLVSRTHPAARAEPLGARQKPGLGR